MKKTHLYPKDVTKEGYHWKQKGSWVKRYRCDGCFGTFDEKQARALKMWCGNCGLFLRRIS